MYGMILEETSVFWEILVSVIVRKKSSCGHVYTSEWLPRCSRLNPQITRDIVMGRTEREISYF
jgi:hypothetical protein